MTDVTIDDDGFVKVVIGDAEATIDVYQAHNRLGAIRGESEGEGLAEDAPRPDENTLIAAYVQSLGFPRVSHRAAVKFANAIFARVEDVRKKDESAASPSPSAASQSSTGSPSST